MENQENYLNRDSENREYSEKYLQEYRPQPMTCKAMVRFFDKFPDCNILHIKDLDKTFIDSYTKFLNCHKRNSIDLTEFSYQHIISGCTHYIDDIYQRGLNPQILQDDYKYHERLNPNINYSKIGYLIPDKPLLVSCPFPRYGDTHPKWKEILDECEEKNIDIHIDGAWFTASRNIHIHDHVNIKSFASSLSKAGFVGHRVGVRYLKEYCSGPVTIANEFNMNHQLLVYMGLKFIEEFGAEFLWNEYETYYSKICKDFGLEETNSIHIALKNSFPVGIRPLLRCFKA